MTPARIQAAVDALELFALVFEGQFEGFDEPLHFTHQHGKELLLATKDEDYMYVFGQENRTCGIFDHSGRRCANAVKANGRWEVWENGDPARLEWFKLAPHRT